MLADMWRVLKPGGRLVIMAINPGSLLAAAYSYFVRLKEMLGIASKGERALRKSIGEAIPEKKVLGMFDALGIPCVTSKSLLALYYEAVKPE